MEALPAIGNSDNQSLSTKDGTLETASSMLQSFNPTRNICAHLNAFHVYANDTSRHVEANHYCSHPAKDFRQCLLYDSPEPNARLIGIEYMISPSLFNTLEADEKKFWHSHVFEVKSGMLIMPRPTGVPDNVWTLAETEEMKEVIVLYGKAIHTWQVDRGDQLPLGEPQLMTSFAAKEHFPRFEEVVGDRDKRFEEDWKRKKEARKEIKNPTIDENADVAWKKA